MVQIESAKAGSSQITKKPIVTRFQYVYESRILFIILRMDRTSPYPTVWPT
jgi:hypothetical protein